jgi:hypothetical protein
MSHHIRVIRPQVVIERDNAPNTSIILNPIPPSAVESIVKYVTTRRGPGNRFQQPQNNELTSQEIEQIITNQLNGMIKGLISQAVETFPPDSVQAAKEALKEAEEAVKTAINDAIVFPEE